jgi:hypothetical protein
MLIDQVLVVCSQYEWFPNLHFHLYSKALMLTKTQDFFCRNHFSRCGGAHCYPRTWDTELRGSQV